MHRTYHKRMVIATAILAIGFVTQSVDEPLATILRCVGGAMIIIFSGREFITAS